MNAQFENTGIKYELISEQPEAPKPDAGNKNPIKPEAPEEDEKE